MYGKIVSEAYRAGALRSPNSCPPPPGSFAADAAGLRDSILAGVPDEIIASALAAWTGLFGLLSFELFGQFENVITDRAAFFGHSVGCLGRLAGLAEPSR